MADDMVVTQHQVEVEVDGLPTEMAKHGLLRYNSPLAQVFLIGLVCFCCPGMFNALSGLGGGGQLDHATIDKANTALYTCFAVFGVVGGAAHNLFGPRNTLLLGALAYPLYAMSFLYYNHHHTNTFAVIAGTLLGAGAGLLWASQGAILTSYPPADRRGTYISIFWCLYNLGGVFGGLFPFSFNYHRGSRKAASVNDGTYIAFMAFMLIGAALTLLILPPNKIVRDDGSKATGFAYSVAKEGTEILKLFTNWKMLLVLPAAWTSNFFYTYQFNNVNGVLFTLRTQGLNNVFYCCRKRGLIGVTIVTVLGTAIWGGGLANQLRYRDGQWQEELIDFKDGRRYAGPFLLFSSYGLLDAMFQSLVYWIIGALANDSQMLSRYVGFYNGVQSAGAAVAWQIDMHKTSLITQLIVNWALMTVSCPLLVLLLLLAVKD
ncbi:hypothetical protein SORBI_3006G003700 [Sorghum bicolor]|uniref:Major facilitator superfamily (MFS) profile domain-containing protein n=1 Tax=Sorghum bicolor TaxID=4558 RepID=A0A1Z5RBT7_SORBI|nr:hypothetical protein SORBI_3006G003700 [Sorghum bicolor]